MKVSTGKAQLQSGGKRVWRAGGGRGTTRQGKAEARQAVKVELPRLFTVCVTVTAFACAAVVRRGQSVGFSTSNKCKKEGRMCMSSTLEIQYVHHKRGLIAILAPDARFKHQP